METAADGGKMYYYNAATRATQWTKPEGPDVKILTQEEVEKLQKMMGGVGGGEVSYSDIEEFDDGLDDELMGDEEDRRRLEEMNEKEREEEIFKRTEKREMLKKRYEIEKKLKMQKKKSKEEEERINNFLDTKERQTRWDRNRGIIIKLPDTTFISKEVIKAHFEHYGEVLEVEVSRRGVSRWDSASKISRFAFIVFARMEVAKLLIGKGTTTIGGYQIEIQKPYLPKKPKNKNKNKNKNKKKKLADIQRLFSTMEMHWNASYGAFE